MRAYHNNRYKHQKLHRANGKANDNIPAISPQLGPFPI